MILAESLTVESALLAIGGFLLVQFFGVIIYFVTKHFNKADATREDFHKLNRDFAKIEMKVDALFRSVDEIKALLKK